MGAKITENSSQRQIILINAKSRGSRRMLTIQQDWRALRKAWTLGFPLDQGLSSKGQKARSTL
jgi:hypothetical protein